MNLNDFPKPNYDVEGDRNIVRMNDLENALYDMGFSVDTGKDVIDAIEQNHLDLSQFDFPYGSFEVFREHALSGEFDIDVYSCAASSEEIAELHQLIKDKKLCVRY